MASRIFIWEVLPLRPTETTAHIERQVADKKSSTWRTTGRGGPWNSKSMAGSGDDELGVSVTCGSLPHICGTMYSMALSDEHNGMEGDDIGLRKSLKHSHTSFQQHVDNRWRTTYSTKLQVLNKHEHVADDMWLCQLLKTAKNLESLTPNPGSTRENGTVAQESSRVVDQKPRVE